MREKLDSPIFPNAMTLHNQKKIPDLIGDFFVWVSILKGYCKFGFFQGCSWITKS